MESLLRYMFVGVLIVGVALFATVLFLPDLVTDGLDEGGSKGGAENNTLSNGGKSDSGVRDQEPSGGYTLSPGAGEDDRDAPNTTDPDRVWFEEVGEEAGLGGLDVRKYLPPNRTIPPKKEGEWSGIYVSDYDHNSRPDLLAVLNGTPVVYENDRDGYTEAEVLPEIDAHVTAAHFLDYDNDGYDDLYLLSDERSVFLENAGGVYERRRVGLEVSYQSVRGAATADYTGNGCADVFVIQSEDWEGNRPSGYSTTDISVDEDNGNRNRLFAGDCEEFEETTEEAGIRDETWSLATSFVDLTNDGHPDIHVANDFNNDVLYINNGDGTFDRRVLPNSTNRNGMSSEVADVNDDGFLDIFVTNIHHSGAPGSEAQYGGRVKGNNLLLNEGNGSFTDVAEEYGVRRGGFGWSTEIEDFDNDGELDIYQSDSLVWSRRYPNFWRGIDDGFERLNSSKMGFSSSEHLGAAVLDYDGDGALDIATSDITQRGPFYRNKLSGGNWLGVRLETEGNNTPLGSNVVVTTRTEDTEKVWGSNSDYFSQGSRTLHFGLGNSTVEEIRVNWSSGTTEVYDKVEANRYVRLTPSEKLGRD